jgi:thiol-disulfide isomerase/thioredoxin
MYWPDYNPRKKRRGSWIGPTIFLGLIVGALFGVFSGILPGSQLLAWWDRSPADTHAPDELLNSAQALGPAVEEPHSPTPIPTVAVQTQNSVTLAPDFVLPDLFDESLNRGLSGLSGRPVVLNFWASWCVPCKEEMPALQRAYEEYRGEGLVVLGLNQTFIDDLDAARAFVDGLTLTFPNVRDDTGNTSEGLYQVMGLPTSVFVTADGEIVHRQIGQMSDQQIDTFSRQLVTGEAITP